jgi:CTP:molybdopterin cytidylyltransferase MocA
MGFDKAIRRCGDLAPLERIACALGDRDSIVVVPPHRHAAAAAMMPRSLVLTNDQRWRGMAHSLRIALPSIAPTDAVGVLLADMPAMTDVTLARTEALLRDGVDVAFPVRSDGLRGHPVLFSPRVRAKLEQLRDGDTLRLVRDDPSYARVGWTCTDESAFLDLDYPAEWEAFANA